jgi:NAD-dependent dihydropyrimidine dehydrogenase PreA subunit
MEYDVPTLRFHIITVFPQTNIVMDPKQLATHIAPIPLDSHCADDFVNVNECNCVSGCMNCQAELQLTMTNHTLNEVPVFSDDIAATDPRVKPTHRTFVVDNVYSLKDSTELKIVTTEPHTFDVGDVVTFPECESPKQPIFGKVIRRDSDQSVVIRPLLGVDWKHLQLKITKISNRQLLYFLGPNQTISFKGTATKGTGRDWKKWSPCFAFYRPLFYDTTIDPKIESKLSKQQRKEFISSCPKTVLDIEDGCAVISRPDECDGCRQCIDWASSNGFQGLIELPKKKRPEWQRFNVKTTGSRTAVDVCISALNIIIARLDQIALLAESQLQFPELKKR